MYLICIFYTIVRFMSISRVTTAGISAEFHKNQAEKLRHKGVTRQKMADFEAEPQGKALL